MRLGKSSLTQDEMRTEAQVHVEALKSCTEAMAPNEKAMVTKLAGNFEKYGPKTFISSNQLFWLRDIHERF
jgi:hypothetical protein